MIDLHTHILPEMDDGSASVEQTARMLREESDQGTRIVVATPHFYGDRVPIETFLAARRKAFLRMRDDIYAPKAGQSRSGFVSPADAEAPLPGILTGAEVYFFPGMGRAEKLPLLTIGRTKSLLVEMPFAQWGEEELAGIREILDRQGLHVILAHVERYPQFQRDRRVWNEIMSMPVVKQINAGSLLQSRSRRRFVMDLLKQNEDIVLGSDCHNTDSRPVNIRQARDAIEKKLGKDRLQQMDELAAGILKERL